MKRIVMLTAATLLLAVGCTKIDYVGKEFSPTVDVDIFFSLDDVEREYEVMGHVTATADDMVSAEKMQEEILKKAREKGADAVVILGLERYSTSTPATWSETTKTEETETGTKTTTTGTSSSGTEEQKEIRATFLKYRRL
ncbi:MAG: hypothetical protein PHD74_06135 [Candidatus Krumholzibacteria bacterium]|nr:hypothetical protein [Candidatus Krumholzibacteria bacterium]